MIVIYKIESPSNKIYIGQTVNLRKRVNNYRSLYCKNQKKLYNSILKYGWDNHILSIIQELPIDCPQEIVDNQERLYWELYKDCGYEMLNLKVPGFSRGSLSEESKQKIREKAKGHKRNVGKKHSEITKQKISDSHLGMKHTVESKEKISKNTIFRNLSKESIQKRASKRRGKIFCKITRKYIDPIK